MKIAALFLSLLVGCTACNAPPMEYDSTPIGPPGTVGGYDMGNLPVSRTETLVPGDGVPSNLLNEIQDQFVALNLLLTGAAQANWTTVFSVTDNLAGIDGICTTASFTYGSHGQIQSTATSNVTFLWRLPFSAGDKITGLTLARLGTGGGDFTATVRKITSTDGSSSLGSATVTGAAASWIDTSITITPTTLVAGEILILEVVVTAAGASTLAVNHVRPGRSRP